MATRSQHSKVLVVAASIAAPVMLGCDDRPTTDREESPERTEQQARAEQPEQPKAGTEQPPKAPLEDVAEEPFRYYGQRVTVVGEVDDVHSDRAFELENQDWIFDEEVLVLTKSPVMLGQGAPEDGDDLVVVGKVQRLAEVGAGLGWTVEPDLQTRWADRPVLMAEEIRAVEETARWREQTQGQAQAQADDNAVLIGVWTLYTIPDPRELAGRSIEIDSVTVQALADTGLWVGTSDQYQTFVATPQRTKPDTLQVGDSVMIQGKLQTMPEADTAMSRFGFAPDMRDKVEKQLMYIDAAEVQKVEKPREPEKGAALQR